MAVRTKLFAGICAATLALTGCDEDEPNEPGASAEDGGGVPGNDNDGGTGSQMDADMPGPGMMPPPATSLGDNVAGQPCSTAADCEGEGTECTTMIGGFAGIGGSAAEGGYCSGPCNDDSDCGAGGACAGALGGFLQGTCQKACEADSDCREAEGYYCSDNEIMIPDGAIPGMGDGGMGLPPGAIPEQPKTCLPKPDVVMLGEGVVGQACTEGSDTCTGGECLTMTPANMLGGTPMPLPGGYCSGGCVDDASCGDTGVCVGTIPVVNPVGYCLETCTQPADCTREGYTCMSVGGPFGGDASACVPEMEEGDAGVPDAG